MVLYYLFVVGLGVWFLANWGVVTLPICFGIYSAWAAKMVQKICKDDKEGIPTVRHMLNLRRERIYLIQIIFCLIAWLVGLILLFVFNHIGWGFGAIFIPEVFYVFDFVPGGPTNKELRAKGLLPPKRHLRIAPFFFIPFKF
jgi:hypothetical protein